MTNSSLIFAPEAPTVQVVHVKVKATGGTWAFTVNGGAPTSALAYNVSGSAATTAANLVSTPGTVVITGGPGDSAGSTDYVFTSSSEDLVIVTDATLLTGSTHTAAVTIAVPGVPTWGNTPVSGWREIPVSTDGGKTRDKPLDFTGISSDAGSAASDAFHRQVIEGGDLVFDAPGISNGLGALLATGCDSAVSSHTGTLAYTQVFTWGPQGPPKDACLSAAWRRLRKGTDVLDEFLYPGCRATQVDVGCSVDNNLSIKVTTDSKPPELAGSLPSRSIDRIVPDVLYAWSDAVITIGGDTICATDFSLALPTGIDVEDKCMNSAEPRHIPMRKGRPALTGSLNWLYTDPVYYNAWVNGTILPLVATWTGPVAIEGSTYPSLAIEVGGIRFKGDDPQVSVSDPTKQTLPFDIIVNDTYHLTMTFVTSDSAL